MDGRMLLPAFGGFSLGGHAGGGRSPPPEPTPRRCPACHRRHLNATALQPDIAPGMFT